MIILSHNHTGNYKNSSIFTTWLACCVFFINLFKCVEIMTSFICCLSSLRPLEALKVFSLYFPSHISSAGGKANMTADFSWDNESFPHRKNPNSHARVLDVSYILADGATLVGWSSQFGLEVCLQWRNDTGSHFFAPRQSAKNKIFLFHFVVAACALLALQFLRANVV